MKRWVLIGIAAFAFVGFGALGVWQVERRGWKLALIERVEARVHAVPVAAPGPAEWPLLNRESAEYRHVSLSGRFLEGRETLVRAVTELGEGFWLMAPLETESGFTVLVNRGFVPQSWRDTDTTTVQAARARDAASPNAEGASRGADVGASHPENSENSENTAATGNPAGSANTAHSAANSLRSASIAGTPANSASGGADNVAITGLLRITEPHGAFLRANAPADNRWYSRDVEAIANAQHLADVAPYFVDAEAAPGAVADPRRPPVPGLTVVQFRNSHLQYAITWFALALMALGLGVRVARNR